MARALSLLLLLARRCCRIRAYARNLGRGDYVVLMARAMGTAMGTAMATRLGEGCMYLNQGREFVRLRVVIHRLYLRIWRA